MIYLNKTGGFRTETVEIKKDRLVMKTKMEAKWTWKKKMKKKKN